MDRRRAGFGFGGAPHGLATDGTGTALLQTNNPFADISTGATTSPPSWNQVYSQPVDTSSGRRWRTTGIDVTTVWQYLVHPDVSNLHLLANADIGLSRSDDGGDTWQLIAFDDQGTRWLNWYQLAVSPDGALIAAVSEEHDLPLENQLTYEASHTGYHRRGAVLTSNDDGLTWSPVAGLFPTSVLSVGHDGTDLYAAVWQSGVYKLVNGTWQIHGGTLQGEPVARLCWTGNQLFCLVSGYASGKTGLYRWNDGSGDWTSLTAGLRGGAFYGGSNFYPIGFAVDPAKTSSIWLAAYPHGGKDTALWHSGDGGATWTRMIGSGTPPFDAGDQGNLQLLGVTLDPYDQTGSTVYVTISNYGIGYSTDTGQTWRLLTVVPSLRALHLDFDPHDPGSLYVTTNGASAWRTLTPANAASIVQRIRRTAYGLWQQRGHPTGHSLTDWADAEQEILEDAIRARAYALYELRDRAPDHALDDWLQAEDAVRAALQL